MSVAEPIIPRKIWTRADVDLLPPEAFSLELINGELIDRMGKKPPHIFWKNRLQKWLVSQFGFDWVRSEDPIDVAPEDNPINEPEPDLAVTHMSINETRGKNPKPTDTRLIVEISDKLSALTQQSNWIYMLAREFRNIGYWMFVKRMRRDYSCI